MKAATLRAYLMKAATSLSYLIKAAILRALFHLDYLRYCKIRLNG